jgi:hypothetical protein
MRLSAHQRRVVREALAEANRLGASPKVKKALIAAGLVESNLQNLNHGDRDSLGFLQQRPSQGWGSPQQVRDVRYATRQFVRRAQPLARQYGSAGALAQAVQRSAFPARYGQRAADAERILSEFVQAGGGSSRSKSGVFRPNIGGIEQVTIPGEDRSADRRFLLQQYLLEGDRDPDALLKLGVQLSRAQDTDPQTTSRFVPRDPGPGPAPSFGGKGGGAAGRGEVVFDPNADRPGAQTRGGIRYFTSLVAGHYGKPVRVGTGTRHSRMTVNGNVSEHWTGNAVDIPASGAELTRLGYAALRAAGVPAGRARQMARQGGLFNLNWRGRRVQIIFKTNEGGNHHDHLHIGLSGGGA